MKIEVEFKDPVNGFQDIITEIFLLETTLTKNEMDILFTFKTLSVIIEQEETQYRVLDEV